MNVKVYNGAVEVTLSRRNLETLLHKLDQPADESANTIMRLCENGLFLRITGEDNDVHYGERTAGEMHPREESVISRPSSGVQDTGWSLIPIVE